MRLITKIFFLLLLTGCGTIECIDAQFEREPEAIEGQYTFRLQQPDGEIHLHQIKCERYYDSICAERGNSWRIREVGLTSTYNNSTLPLQHISGEEYKLELPICSKLIEKNGAIKLKDTHVVWGRDKVKIEKTESGSTTTSWLGRRYQYVSSQNNTHTFQYGGYRDTPLETIEFEFDLSLNGVKVLVMLEPTQ